MHRSASRLLLVVAMAALVLAALLELEIVQLAGATATGHLPAARRCASW